MIIFSTRTHQNASGFRSDGSFPELEADRLPVLNARMGTDNAPNLDDILTEDAKKTPEETPDRERIRILLLGSSLGVTRTIQTLDRLNFVELHRWSQFVRAPEQLHLAPQPGEVLSILTRYWLRGG